MRGEQPGHSGARANGDEDRRLESIAAFYLTTFVTIVLIGTPLGLWLSGGPIWQVFLVVSFYALLRCKCLDFGVDCFILRHLPFFRLWGSPRMIFTEGKVKQGVACGVLAGITDTAACALVIYPPLLEVLMHGASLQQGSGVARLVGVLALGPVVVDVAVLRLLVAAGLMPIRESESGDR